MKFASYWRHLFDLLVCVVLFTVFVFVRAVFVCQFASLLQVGEVCLSLLARYILSGVPCEWVMCQGHGGLNLSDLSAGNSWDRHMVVVEFTYEMCCYVDRCFEVI